MESTVDYFKEQRMNFSPAEAFRSSKPKSDLPDTILDALVGMKKPPIPAFDGPPMAPVFTWLIENDKSNLYKDDRFTLFLNSSLPYVEQYPLDKAGTASMSVVHLLACPNERIYNAVSLLPSDVELLKHMKDTVTRLMDQPFDETDPNNFKNKCITALDAKMKTQNLGTELALRYAADIETFKNTGGSQMRFYFHVHPNHSVGHLHMHCLENNLRTSYIHEHKNTSYDDIVSVLN